MNTTSVCNQEGQCPFASPLPPFDKDSAAQKVQSAEDAWNTRDPHKVASANGASLISKGLIYAPEHGVVAFTVPSMAGFIQRQPEP